MPTVSVIIPTYNAGHYVVQAVQSVLAQTHQDIEIIVVDDGSTDHTRTDLAEFAGQIRYVYQENQERSVARNTGIAHAQGEYIAFLDADDYWQPTKVAKQLASLEEHPQWGAVYTHLVCVAPDGAPLSANRQIAFPPAGDTNLLPHLLYRHFLGCSSVLVRHTVVQQLGGFDVRLRYIEDWDFNLRLAVLTPIACVAEPLACYRQYPGKVVERAVRHGVQDTIPVMLERVLNMLDEQRWPAILHRHVLANAWWHCAKLDYATGNAAAGAQRFARALEYDSSALLDPAHFVEDVVNAALGLYAVSATPFAEAQAMIDTVFGHLPPAAASVHRLRRHAQARLHAAYLFASKETGDRAAWRHGLQAVANDPNWARNAGLWSIAAESLLGTARVDIARKLIQSTPLAGRFFDAARVSGAEPPLQNSRNPQRS